MNILYHFIDFDLSLTLTYFDFDFGLDLSLTLHSFDFNLLLAYALTFIPLSKLNFLLGHEDIPTMIEVITLGLNGRAEEVHWWVTFPYRSDQRIISKCLSLSLNLVLSLMSCVA